MIFAILLVFIGIGRLLYSFYFFRPIAGLQFGFSKTNEYVSIIVCAKNECENLRILLPLLLNQSYKNKEIIVVNDFSIDRTSELLLNFPEIKVVEPAIDQPGKKMALTSGIKAAKYSWILVTDADCRPSSDWAETMMASKKENEVLLGYGPMDADNTEVQQFSSFETTVTAMNYMGYTLRGIPYMGVGRNLLFKKKLFNEIGGFKNHEHIVSGDDDLFIQDLSDDTQIGICLDQASWVLSAPKKNWTSFFRQKLRHISTSNQYKNVHKILLGQFALLQVFWLLILIIGFGTNFWFTFVSMLLFYAAYWLITKSVFRLLGYRPNVIVWRDIQMSLYFIILAILSLIYTKRDAWN